MRKVKKWLPFEIDDCNLNDRGEKKPKITDEFCTQTGKDELKEDFHRQPKIESSMLSDWSERFIPKSINDLCIHAKKIQEVEQWLKTGCSNRSSSMLLLTGPPGSGKTTTVQLVAKQLNICVSEWITPIDLDSFGKLENCRFDILPENQSSKFSDFILKSGCYNSLLTNSRRIVLVEDFPNAFIKKPSEFHDALEKYNDRGKSPIIFICTDAREESLNLSRTLFPQNVRERYNIENINFNAVSTTGLKVALKKIATLMSKHYSSIYNTPQPELIDCVIGSSFGDIRSAVINLHFASLKGKTMPKIASEPLQIQVGKNISKSGKTRKKEPYKSVKFNSLGKNPSLSILHGVGRVLNPKLLKSPTKRGHIQLSHQPQTIVEQFLIQPTIFLGFLYENYIPHFSDVHHVAKASEKLSDSDYFMSEWRDECGKAYGLYVSISGLMLANKAPVSAWYPVRGPKNMKIQYPYLKLDLENDCQFIPGKVLAADYKTYFDIIRKGIKGEINI